MELIFLIILISLSLSLSLSLFFSISLCLSVSLPQSEGLPPGWDAAITPDGKTYYVNHINKKTSWVWSIKKYLFCTYTTSILIFQDRPKMKESRLEAKEQGNKSEQVSK